MGFMTNFKAQKAYRAHAKGDLAMARTGYDQAYAEGMNDPKLLLAYALLLLRAQEYETCIDVLRRAEKAPNVTAEQKQQAMVHYAICIAKQGKIDRAIELLQNQFHRAKSGFLFGTLGSLLIEKGDAEAALAFNREAIEYDEEDPIFLDNMGQTYYRLMQDKEAAKPFFARALAKKPTAIDTNYYLAQYDLDAGDTAAAIEKLETAVEGRFSPLNSVTKEQVQTQLDALRKVGERP